MSWYIYKEDSSNYYAILDHNTTANVAWNSSNVNTSQKEIAVALSNDISGWDSRLSTRLITADEIVQIIGADDKGFNVSSATSYVYFDSGTNTRPSWTTSRGQSEYAWLFDYTSNCYSVGCNFMDSSTTGYWTSTPSANNGVQYVWSVARGMMTYGVTASDTSRGVRPVIEVPKLLFE